MKKQPKFPKNWIVRAYKNSSLIDSWEISDRFEWEAAKEAQSDILRLGNKCDDWSMTAKRN